MKKKVIAITSRELYLRSKKRKKDFISKDWYKLAKNCDFEILPLKNSDHKSFQFLNKKKVKGIIFSGGGPITKNLGKISFNKDNSINSNRDVVETKLYRVCKKKNIPLLGVCRGMQVINLLEGGKIHKIRNHVSKIHDLKLKKNFTKKFQLPKKVNSFHDYGIKRQFLARKLKEIGFINNYIEVFKHESKEIYGIMWHPERRSPQKKIGYKFIKQVFDV